MNKRLVTPDEIAGSKPLHPPRPVPGVLMVECIPALLTKGAMTSRVAFPAWSRAHLSKSALALAWRRSRSGRECNCPTQTANRQSGQIRLLRTGRPEIKRSKAGGLLYRKIRRHRLRDVHGRSRHNYVSAQRYAKVAATPSRVRTACSRPHNSSRARDAAPASASATALSL